MTNLNETQTPPVPFSGLTPLRVTVTVEKRVVFERAAIKALAISLRRCLKTATALCDEVIQACA